jgi:hypothetical protein
MAATAIIEPAHGPTKTGSSLLDQLWHAARSRLMPDNPTPISLGGGVLGLISARRSSRALLTPPAGRVSGFRRARGTVDFHFNPSPRT